MLPKVSVIIPVFNGEKYIGRCLRSLLNQKLDRKDYEIIIVNDGSNDRTEYALDLFKEEIILFSHNVNKGLPASLNTGIKKARGQFVVRLDADDYVHSEYLNMLHLFLSFNNHFDAVACDYLEVDDDEDVLRRVDCIEEPIGCGIMFRQDHLLDLGLYDEEMLLHEDKDLRFRFEKKYKVTRLPIPLYRYRKHDNNMTNNKDKMSNYLEVFNRKCSTDNEGIKDV